MRGARYSVPQHRCSNHGAAGNGVHSITLGKDYLSALTRFAG